MHLKTLIIAACIALSGCGVELDTTFEVEMDHHEVNWSAYMKQVDGIIYLVDANGYCIAIDPSTLYGKEWKSIEDQDKNRATDYTFEEAENCSVDYKEIQNHNIDPAAEQYTLNDLIEAYNAAEEIEDEIESTEETVLTPQPVKDEPTQE